MPAGLLLRASSWKRMRRKSPVSSICRLACAKRASSRSSTGIAAIPVLDRDEARFAQASRQMLETGDFLRIRFQDEARNNKPVAIYWLQAASVAALSDAASTCLLYTSDAADDLLCVDLGGR